MEQEKVSSLDLVPESICIWSLTLRRLQSPRAKATDPKVEATANGSRLSHQRENALLESTHTPKYASPAILTIRLRQIKLVEIEFEY